MKDDEQCKYTADLDSDSDMSSLGLLLQVVEGHRSADLSEFPANAEAHMFSVCLWISPDHQFISINYMQLV